MRFYEFRQKYSSNFFGLSAFIFFAFCISTSFGYSMGALLTLFLALVNIDLWGGKPLKNSSVGLVSLFVVSGIFWNHTFDGGWVWYPHYDKIFQYGLAVICILFASVVTLPSKFIRSGVIVGCISAFLLGIYQFSVSGRAEGYTNAIRYGDIAIFLGFTCWCFAMVRTIPSWERLLLTVAGILGLCTSLLSLSRGGWIFLLFIPLLFTLFAENFKQRFKIFFIVFAAIAAFSVAASQIPVIQNRVHEIKVQAEEYLERNNSVSSVGARLEQWKLAWMLGRDKPWTGWGDNKVERGREYYVGQGVVTPFALEISHAHNDFLNLWARRGIIGILALLVIYMIPIIEFFPTKKRREKVDKNERMELVALRIIGISIPISYFVFGLTEFFFYLNITHIFYLFSIIYVFSAIRHLENVSRHS